MSYASVAAHNAPPLSQQPQPDPALLTTEPPSSSNIADDAAKLNIVSPGFKEHPETVTSTLGITPDAQRGPLHEPHIIDDSLGEDQPKKRKGLKNDQSDTVGDLKRYLLRPSVAGGLLGVVNVGLLSGIGYLAYTKPALRQNVRVVSATAVGILAVAGLEGYIAEETVGLPRERRERKGAARKRASGLVPSIKEHLLRPGVLGGIVGLVNAGILGTVGYLTFVKWDRRWDNRVVSGVSIGLLTVWAGEGYLAEQYYQKQK